MQSIDVFSLTMIMYLKMKNALNQMQNYAKSKNEINHFASYMKFLSKQNVTGVHLGKIVQISVDSV